MILQKEYPKIDFEILLFAAGGYSTQEEVAGYEKYGRHIKPDLVILAYCFNDVFGAHNKIVKKEYKEINCTSDLLKDKYPELFNEIHPTLNPSIDLDK